MNLQINEFMEFVKSAVDFLMPLFAINTAIIIAIWMIRLILSVASDVKSFMPNIDIEAERKRKAKDHHYEYDGEGTDYGEVVGIGDDGEMIFEDKNKKSP